MQIICKSHTMLTYIPPRLLLFLLSPGCGPWEIQAEAAELQLPLWLSAEDGTFVVVEVINLRQVSDQYSVHLFPSKPTGLLQRQC